MNVSQLKQEGLRYEFKVTVPHTDVKVAVEKRLTAISARVKVDGFRPGKVPMDLVRQRHGGQALGEVVEDLVNSSTQKALTEKGLRPAVQPRIALETYPDDKDLEYTLTVEVLPTFTPMDVTSLKLERLVAAPSDADVAARLTEMAARLPRTESAPDGYAAKMGDTAVISFAGKLDGTPRKEMDGTRYPLELGSDSFIPGFEEQLVGVKKGDQKTITLAFPENYGSPEFAGKPAEFAVTVDDLRVAATPKVDDEFAKMLGVADLAALQENVKKSLEGDFTAMSRSKLKRSVMDKLADGHSFAVPQAMVDQEFDSIWKQLMADKERGQLDADDSKKSDEQLKADYQKIAERRVRLGLVLAEIGTAQKVKVETKDLQNALRQEAARYPGQEQQVVDFYLKNQGALQAIQAALFEDKVIDKIIETATVTDKTVTVEQLRQEEA